MLPRHTPASKRSVCFNIRPVCVYERASGDETTVAFRLRENPADTQRRNGEDCEEKLLSTLYVRSINALFDINSYKRKKTTKLLFLVSSSF